MVCGASEDSSAEVQQLQSSQWWAPPAVLSHSLGEPQQLGAASEASCEQREAQQGGTSTFSLVATCSLGAARSPQVQAESIGWTIATAAIASKAAIFVVRRWRVERRMKKLSDSAESYLEILPIRTILRMVRGAMQ